MGSSPSSSSQPEQFKDVLFKAINEPNITSRYSLRIKAFKKAKIVAKIEIGGEANRVLVCHRGTMITIYMIQTERREEFGTVSLVDPLTWHYFYQIGHNCFQSVTEHLLAILHESTVFHVHFIDHLKTIQSICQGFPKALESSAVWINKEVVTAEELDFLATEFQNLKKVKLPESLPDGFERIFKKYDRLTDLD